MKKIQLMIDPPGGWRYGFPRVYENPEGLSVNEWLLKKGYPQKEIDSFAGKEVPCRFWEHKED